MRSINEFLIKKHQDRVCPKNKEELIEIIKDALYDNITDLNFIDTSKITDMSDLFSQETDDWHETIGIQLAFAWQDKLNISDWDVSNVENMDNMFSGCKWIENCNISKWDVSKVKNMKYNGMFGGCNVKFIPKWYKNIIM